MTDHMSFGNSSQEIIPYLTSHSSKTTPCQPRTSLAGAIDAYDFSAKDPPWARNFRQPTVPGANQK
jgi:hypothetical protein